MGQAKLKQQRKLLREELRKKLEEERVQIMPEVKLLKTAVMNLKPCFECFGLTFFKTKDIEKFYDTLKAWAGDRPRNAKKNFWHWFKKLEKSDLESKMTPEAAHTITVKDIAADDVEGKQ